MENWRINTVRKGFIIFVGESLDPPAAERWSRCNVRWGAERIVGYGIWQRYHRNAKQINSAVGTTIGRPQNDGRFRYRKRETGIQHLCHADEQCSSLRRTGVLDYKSLPLGGARAPIYLTFGKDLRIKAFPSGGRWAICSKQIGRMRGWVSRKIILGWRESNPNWFIAVDFRLLIVKILVNTTVFTPVFPWPDKNLLAINCFAPRMRSFSRISRCRGGVTLTGCDRR